LPPAQQKMLGLPDAWERDVVHRYTFVKLKPAAAKSMDLGNRPSMPMSLDLRGMLAWAWLLPHAGQVQLAVEQPAHTCPQVAPNGLC